MKPRKFIGISNQRTYWGWVKILVSSFRPMEQVRHRLLIGPLGEAAPGERPLPGTQQVGAQNVRQRMFSKMAQIQLLNSYE